MRPRRLRGKGEGLRQGLRNRTGRCQQSQAVEMPAEPKAAAGITNSEGMTRKLDAIRESYHASLAAQVDFGQSFGRDESQQQGPLDAAADQRGLRGGAIR